MEEVKDRKLWVYDVETLKSCFTYTAINIDSEQIVQFVIHKDRDDSVNLLKHLKEDCNGQIGFNNVNFDYPILHKIILCAPISVKDLLKLTYEEAQRLVNNLNPQFGSGIREQDVMIKQLDLYRMWHYNNQARSTSLKALEISMNYPNVMEMAISHSKEDVSLTDVKHILEYNLNDVLATYEFYKLSKDKIGLRKSLNAKYKLNCENYSDSKIGESLVLKLYCDKTGLNPWDVKKFRTKRDKINLKDCIFDYIKFASNEFNQLLSTFNSKTISETKGSIEESFIYKGFKYDYGLGGIHGCIKAGVYESDNEFVIIDCDVASLYPSIAVLNKLYPEHLGVVFCDIYEGILKQRIDAKKAGNMVLSDGFKLALNSVYGKSNDEFSFLMDPMYTMKTTLNGQLMLTMLCEALVDGLDELQMLQVNTDGITVKIKRSEIDKYYSICKQWESLTKLTLEYVEYSKMIIRDVNNYIAVKYKKSIDKPAEVKYKGAFEINKDYHKDNSFKIIPIALSEYFVNGVAVEHTIKNHNEIYDFCGRQKFKGNDYGVTHTLKYDKNNVPYDETVKQQKNVRYYISKNGSTFVKHYFKGSEEVINKGFQVTIFNKYVEKPINEYNINYDFYIKECYKEIDNINDKQLKLF